MVRKLYMFTSHFDLSLVLKPFLFPCGLGGNLSSSRILKWRYFYFSCQSSFLCALSGSLRGWIPQFRSNKVIKYLYTDSWTCTNNEGCDPSLVTYYHIREKKSARIDTSSPLVRRLLVNESLYSDNTTSPPLNFEVSWLISQNRLCTFRTYSLLKPFWLPATITGCEDLDKY